MRFFLYLIIAIFTCLALSTPSQAVAPAPIPGPSAMACQRLCTVQFADETVTLPACTSWSWDFGDGSSSTSQTPSHVYWKAGSNYTVTFSCTSPGGTGTNYTYVAVSEMYRPKATITIAAEPTDAYTQVMNAIGGSSPSNATFPSFLTGLSATMIPYTYVLGNAALVIIFLIPFLMMWLMQRNLTIPGIIGLVLGGVVFTKLPSEYQIVATAFIALSITAIIYSLMKDRT